VKITKVMGGVLEKLTKPREPNPITGNLFFPSWAGMCPRWIYYAKTIGTKVDKNTNYRFIIGNMAHEYFEKLISDNYDVAIEYPFQTDYEKIHISGRIDIMTEKGIIDLKTTNDLNTTKLPKYSDIAQVQLYLHFMNKKDGMLIYIDVNRLLLNRTSGHAFMEVRFNYDENIATNVLRKFEYVYEYYMRKTPPPMDNPFMNHSDIECQYCPFKEVCKNGINK